MLLKNPVVHRGYFMLMTGSIQCLGGCVQRLEGARQRLLTHWNKPLGCSLLSVQVCLLIMPCCALISWNLMVCCGLLASTDLGL